MSEDFNFEGGLPCDVLQRVMEFSECKDISRHGLVNSAWYSSARRDELWRELSVREFDFPRKGPTHSWKQWFATMKIMNKGWEKGTARNFKMQALRGHKSFITSIQLSDDKLLSSSDDSTVKIWSAADDGSYSIAKTISHNAAILKAQQAYSDDLIIASTSQGTVFGYNIRTDTETTTLDAPADAAEGTALFNYDEQSKLLSVVNGRRLMVWDVSKNIKTMEMELPEEGMYVNSRFNKKQQIVVGSDVDTYVIDIRGTGSKITHHLDTGYSAATVHLWDPDLDSFIVGKTDGKVEIYNTSSGDQEVSFILDSPITAVNRTSNFVAAGDASGEMRLVNYFGGGDCEIRSTQSLTGHDRCINDIAMDGSKVLSASADGTTMIHSVSKGSSQLYSLLGGSLTPNPRNPPNPRKPFASAVRFNYDRVVVAWNSLIRSYNFAYPACEITSGIQGED